MGCDLHGHFEIKLDGKWEHYSNVPHDGFRNYKIFARIAGVRNTDKNTIEPLSPPKGLPPDASKTTIFESEHWGGDGHSHTWLNKDEILALEKSFNDLSKKENWPFPRNDFSYFFGFLCGNSWGSFTKYPEDNPLQIEDIRLICWFDN